MVVSNNNKRVFIELSEEEANDLYSILEDYQDGTKNPTEDDSKYITELKEKILFVL